MSVKRSRLGASSEMLALSTLGFTKNILICLIDVKGPLNVEKLFDSARTAASKFPQLTSVIEDIKHRRLHYLEWKFSGVDSLPVFFHDLSESVSSDSAMERVLSVLTPRLERYWDLLVEVSSEFHCIQVSQERFLFGWIIHHAAGDAALASDVGQETLFRYYEITHGKKLDSATLSVSLSGSQKKPVNQKKLVLSDHIREIRQTARNLFFKPKFPIGSGGKTSQGQNHSKTIFSEQASSDLLKKLRSKGISLIDALVASTNLAVDEWNSARNEEPGLLTTSVSVNMRGRFQNVDHGNSSSLIFFESRPEERIDIQRFVKSIAIKRIHHFRKQVDLKLANNIKRMIDTARIFPYRIRRRIISLITGQHEFSAAVTWLGVIWPKTEGGKLTSDSALTTVGDLTVEEVIGVPYKMLSKTKTLLVVYIFRNRLNFVHSASSSLFTKRENEMFLDTILNHLKRL